MKEVIHLSSADPMIDSTTLWIEETRPALRAYCLSLTSHNWEADDLVQETIMRLLNVRQRDPQKVLSRSYAFRIARNFWIDQRRKLQRLGPNLSGDTLDEWACTHDSTLHTHELLDSIARLLNPKAVVVLLLMDVFQFTAKETAQLISSTEGAVQVALSRARSRLRAFAEIVKGSERHQRSPDSVPDPAWFEAILDGFRNRNPKTIYRAYLRLCEGGVRIRDLRSARGRLFFTFEDPDGNLLLIST